MPARASAAPLLTSEERSVAQELGQLIRAGELAPLVGSGISAKSRLPLWRELVSRIFASWLDWVKVVEPTSFAAGMDAGDYQRVLNQVFQDSLAVSAFVRSQLPIRIPATRRQVTFEELVYGALYGIPELSPTNSLFTPSPTSIHRHLVAMIANKAGRIWTTNYDDLLEEAARQAGINVCTLDLTNHTAREGLKIAHLHGFLASPDRMTKRKTTLKKSRVVLSEDDYHEMTANLVGWTNREFTRLFEEYRVLDLGSSLEDPNLRRVLSTLRKSGNGNGTPHFAILRKPKHDMSQKHLGTTAVRRKSCANDMAQRRSAYWASLGVRIIELPDHDSLLPFLMRVRYESHGDRAGDLWREGSAAGYVAAGASDRRNRKIGEEFLRGVLPILMSEFGVSDPTEIVEIGVFLLQPDGHTLKLVFRSDAAAAEKPHPRTFCAAPDEPTGIAGRIFVSGEGVRVSRRDNLHDFGLRGTARKGSGSYEGIISVPIVDWRQGGLPIGVAFVTTSTTAGTLFKLPTRSTGGRGRSLDDLQTWLSETAMFLIDWLRKNAAASTSGT